MSQLFWRRFPLLAFTKQAACGQHCNGELCRERKRKSTGEFIKTLAELNMEARETQSEPYANQKPRAAFAWLR